MKILVLHAWLKGNLGDVLQLSVLLTALRDLQPRTLDLAGFPAAPPPETDEVLKLADRYLPDPFPWYWHLTRAVLGPTVFAPRWRRARRVLFAQYDAIVCAPGPYLAEYDPRVTSALSDIATAVELNRPVILASHSIGPLPDAALATVGRATLRVARESSTSSYLCERGISSVLSADLAFLYPYHRVATNPPQRDRAPYRAVFLRSNNLGAGTLRIADGGLFDSDRVIVEPSNDAIFLATSDYRRDGRFLARVSRRLGVPWKACRSVPELVEFIAGSSGVVSDRYHPAICAAAVGKPARVVPNREPHKMHGLHDLLERHSLEMLQELTRTGVSAVQDALRRA